MGIRDCFGIARSVRDGAVNVAYIVAAGNDAADRARRHALQKGYRDLHRKDPTGTVEVLSKNIPPVEDVPGLASALAEFHQEERRRGK